MFEVVNAANDLVNPFLENQSGNCQIFPEGMNVGDFILTIISLFVLISGILSIIFILWGGLLLILSGGKDDKIKPAINTIRYAVIGLIVTVVSIFIFPILGGLLGINVEQYANPGAIIDKSKFIGQCVFTETDNTYGTNTNSTGINTEVDFTDL
ncbi:MAG: hypothetical protein Q9M94_03640 [Candidatus Gracilibacteria bacterium]|nr:hypothetical protein [Candidatus Gracilibacteria bacterium]